MESLLIHITNSEISNRTAVKKFFDILKAKDATYFLSAKITRKRSTRQNAFYWGCVVAMIKERMIELGNDVDSETVHSFLKDRFNSKELFTKDGTIIGSVGATTTDLSTVQFEEYLEKVKGFAATVLDLYIPDPGESVPMFSENNLRIA